MKQTLDIINRISLNIKLLITLHILCYSLHSYLLLTTYFDNPSCKSKTTLLKWI